MDVAAGWGRFAPISLIQKSQDRWIKAMRVATVRAILAGSIRDASGKWNRCAHASGGPH